MATNRPYIPNYVQLDFTKVNTKTGAETILFTNYEVSADITVPTPFEVEIFRTAAGVPTAMPKPSTRSNGFEIETIKTSTIIKLERIARFIRDGGYSCKLTLNKFYDVIESLEWDPAVLPTSAIPGAGDSAYINGDGPVILGLAHVKAYQNGIGTTVPWSYTCVIDFPVQSFREQVHGYGMRASEKITFTTHETFTLTLPTSGDAIAITPPSGVVVTPL